MKIITMLLFSTLGSDSNEEKRICELCSGFSYELFKFDRRYKLRMFFTLVRMIRTVRPRVVVMEGTGLAGGIALILSRWLYRTKYVVSSGDAVGPWVGAHYRLLEPLFTWYEKRLFANASGVIGWTPYIVGRALTFGTPRGVTAAGWAPFPMSENGRASSRQRIRKRLKIPDGAIVIGIAGSLAWSTRHKFCYGWDIVEAVSSLARRDVYALIVGDGTGKEKLVELARGKGCDRVIFAGKVTQSEVAEYLCAMDIGSLPQTVDAVGSFRYTTKISEYVNCRLPMVTSQIPMSYDLDDGWIWRIPGNSPWSARSRKALKAFLEGVSVNEVAVKKSFIPEYCAPFDLQAQRRRVTAFLEDVLDCE